MTLVRSERSAARGAARRPVSSPALGWRGASRLAALVLPAAALLGACGSEDEPDGAAGGGGSGGGVGAGVCNVATVASPPTSARHVTQCTEVAYSTNPPSGGEHYGVWAAFQTYDFPLSAGYLVHDLEHGAVVFWYNCPEGCADEVAEVQALIDGLPTDSLCTGTGVERRAILVPHPELASRWGVSAWGHALTADCVDGEAFGSFYTEHYAQGPEQLCNAGQAFTADPCP